MTESNSTTNTERGGHPTDAARDSLRGVAGVVTGAGSGIGMAVALKLAEVGARVLAVDMADDGLSRLAEAAAAYGGVIEPFVGDVTDENVVKAYALAAAKTFGEVSFFHNNAGVGGVHKRVIATSSEEWRGVMSINLDSVFYGFKYVVPLLVEAGGGAIVVTGSLLSSRASPLRGDYTTSKHAVVGLARTVAIEHARDGVRVNVICPGAIETPLQTQSELLTNPDDPTYERRRIEERAPMGRYGTAREVAELVLTLLSPQHRYMTGSMIALDGGFGAT